MASQIKSILRASRMYPAYREWRDAKALRSWGPADQDRLAFYGGLIRADDLVFDIGANVGNRSKIFLRLGARVVAFEPQRLCANVLRKGLSDNPGFRLVPKALGDKSGVAELHVGRAHFLSTLSREWISAASKSGRFDDQQWRGHEQVEVTTFDEVIREFGSPAFAKIDVEGFESQVIAGLSYPIQSGSLELLAETLDGTIWCLEKLASLQAYRFQYSPGETMRFDWDDWQDLSQARDALSALVRRDKLVWGDVYFRL